ncbi:hypothetical protein BJX62DRAFT_226497 [Aspergillus germanicus]
MLEKFDLDYILLESHSCIALAIGARIGMFPNGLRILDQIGCYKAIEGVFNGDLPYDRQYTGDEEGNVIASIEKFYRKIEERHGYLLLFIDRQTLLQILYDNLRRKEKVLLNKRVERVVFVDGGVNVICADESVYSGTLVVGADGIHSSVRTAMTTLAQELEPGCFDPDEVASIPCRYRCSFGIAQHVPGWVRGDCTISLAKGARSSLFPGPRIRDIPKYTKEDEAEFVRRSADVAISRGVTLGHVYAKRLSSTLAALHEVVFKKWFFRRIITIGDAAHKFCAELVNAILKTKDRRHGKLDDLTDEDIETLFMGTQPTRQARAELIIKEARDTQGLFAYENWAISGFVFRILQPVFGGEAILDIISSVLVGASKFEGLPVPRRPRAILFIDVLPEKPIAGKAHTCVRYACLATMALIVFVGLKPLALPVEGLQAWSSSHVELQWFGDNPVNDFFNLLVGVLAAPIQGGYRVGHRGTLLALSILYSIAMQVQGIGRIAPIYAALFALFSVETPLGQTLPVHTAQCLIPAITIAFLIPTVMALVPSSNTRAWHGWNGIWQIAPPLFNILLALSSAVLKRWRTYHHSPSKKSQEGERDSLPGQRDLLPTLKTVYTYAFQIQATAHIASIAYAYHRPDITITGTFFALPSPFSDSWNLSSVAEAMAALLRWDMVLAVTAFLSSNIYSIWDLRHLGYVRTREDLNAAMLVLAGQVIVGSGATWAGLWYWREGRIAVVSKGD